MLPSLLTVFSCSSVCELCITLFDLQEIHEELRLEERRQTEEHINTLLQVDLFSVLTQISSLSSLSLSPSSFICAYHTTRTICKKTK